MSTQLEVRPAEPGVFPDPTTVDIFRRAYRPELNGGRIFDEALVRMVENEEPIFFQIQGNGRQWHVVNGRQVEVIIE